MFEIYKNNPDAIINQLEVRDINTIKTIRRSLLTKISNLFPDFTPTSAKKRKENRHLICKDIYILGVAILTRTTKGLATVYRTEPHHNMTVINYKQAAPASTSINTTTAGPSTTTAAVTVTAANTTPTASIASTKATTAATTTKPNASPVLKQAKENFQTSKMPKILTKLLRAYQK